MTQDVRAIDWGRRPDRRGRAQAARRGGPPGRARHHRRERVPPLRRPPRARAARRARRDRRHARRRDLPRHDRRRRVDHPPQGGRGLQAPRHARPGPRRRRGDGARGPGRRRRGAARRAHLPRDRVRRARGRRLPALRLLQRRDEHRAVPAPARRLHARPHPARDEGHRAHGRRGLLLQRHPPQRHRGGRRSRPSSRGSTSRRSTTSCARSSRPTRTWSSPPSPATPPPAACPSRSRPIASWRARTSCSTPTTGTWAASTARSTGPTCFRAASGAEVADRLTSAPFAPVGTREAVELGLLDAAVGASADEFQAAVRDLAEHFAHDPRVDERLAEKRRARARDEQIKPLRAYRNEELARSYRCFFGEDRSYHEARHRFVHKLGAPCAVPVPAVAPLRAVGQSARAR